MLKILKEVIKTIPNQLADHRLWSSLIVNRRKPFTYRVFKSYDDQAQYRICLHKFDPCDTHEAFEHPHPWPGAFAILKGSYHMKMGYSVDRVSKPQEVAQFILPTGSCYEIINPLTWHNVIPLETTYTIMVNGPAWDEQTAHQDVKRTKNKDLDKMPDSELMEHLQIFKDLLK